MGHAVNAVFVWSIARAFGGSVLLRIEDHDGRRARDVFDAAIRDDLAWLGLEPDNIALGLLSPLRQRTDVAAYDTALAALLARGVAYACRCSRREIAAQGAEASEHGDRYPGTCRRSEVPLTETPARRVQIGDRAVVFDDLRHGLQTQIPAQQCGDVLVRDRHGQWTYQFAVTVDDFRQNVDVIIRGDDLLPSTGRQLLLAELVGRTAAPLVLHHPLVMHADGAKLSKSRGHTGLSELRAAGWRASAVLGHAAWLGGLQSAPTPLTAVDLASLWQADA
jgi:glutamyl-Q tRNA(Asp) synthetase